jgi:hypothetical protein
MSPGITGGAQMRPRPFNNRRDAALALLNGTPRLSLGAASFLGQMTVHRGDLSEKQFNWLQRLLEKADLPPLVEEGEA